eukprot:GHVR01025076.1.p2 GENE.GHVR01025076.1~~GHVR01025076.1.p2  ORF type:complete len:116 (+),score=7.16 GHVR01025076.1:91-438(+)
MSVHAMDESSLKHEDASQPRVDFDSQLLDTRWVPKCLNKTNFLQWKKIWDIQSRLHLSPVRFQGQCISRADVFNSALLAAADNNPAMLADVLLLIDRGVTEGAIVTELVNAYFRE